MTLPVGVPLTWPAFYCADKGMLSHDDTTCQYSKRGQTQQTGLGPFCYSQEALAWQTGKIRSSG